MNLLRSKLVQFDLILSRGLKPRFIWNHGLAILIRFCAGSDIFGGGTMDPGGGTMRDHDPRVWDPGLAWSHGHATIAGVEPLMNF